MDELAGAFYEGVLDEGQWARGLKSLVEFAGARSAALVLGDFCEQRSAVVLQFGHSVQAVEAYDREFHRLAPMTVLAPSAPPGEWHDWIARSPRFRESPYYREFLSPHGNHFSMSAMLWRDGRQYACISLQRTAQQGSFDAGDARRLAPLTPHLGRASRLHFMTQRLRHEAELRSAMLDRLSVAVFITEADGRVVLANHAAEDLCREGRALRLDAGRLRVRTQPARLQAALRCAVAHDGGVGTCLRVEGGSRQGTTVLVVAPLPMQALAGQPWQKPLAAVIAAGSVQPADDLLGVLRSLFQLTPAEARLARGFVEGLTVPEIAARHAIKEQTVRGQLKSMFQKTGVNRQAELSRLLAGLQTVVPYSARHGYA